MGRQYYCHDIQAGESGVIVGIERGEAPLRNSLPSPLPKGRGIKGEGLDEKISGYL